MNHIVERTALRRRFAAKSSNKATSKRIVSQRTIENELSAVFVKAKSLGKDRAVDVVFHAMRDAGVFPRVEQAPRDREIEKMLELMESAAKKMPSGDEADAFRRNFAIAHDRYAVWKYGNPTAPKKMPPPASAEQLVTWSALLGS